MPIWYSEKLNSKLEKMINSKTHLQLKDLASSYWLNQNLDFHQIMHGTSKHENCVIVASGGYCFVIRGNPETVEKMIMPLDDKPKVKVSKPTPHKVAVKSMRNFFKDVKFFQCPSRLKKNLDPGSLTRVIDFSGFTLNGLITQVELLVQMGWRGDVSRVAFMEVKFPGSEVTYTTDLFILEINNKNILTEEKPGSLEEKIGEFIRRGYTDDQLVEALNQCIILDVHEE